MLNKLIFHLSVPEPPSQSETFMDPTLGPQSANKVYTSLNVPEILKVAKWVLQGVLKYSYIRCKGEYSSVSRVFVYIRCKKRDQRTKSNPSPWPLFVEQPMWNSHFCQFYKKKQYVIFFLFFHWQDYSKSNQCEILISCSFYQAEKAIGKITKMWNSTSEFFWVFRWKDNL